MYVCMYVCMYVRTYVIMYVCMYVCVDVCMCGCMDGWVMYRQDVLSFYYLFSNWRTCLCIKVFRIMFQTRHYLLWFQFT